MAPVYSMLAHSSVALHFRWRADFYSSYSECVAFASTIIYLDYVITGVFLIEFALRSISAGFVLAEGSYLRHGWNRLDFMIVIVSLASLLMSSSAASLGALRSLRTLRALRPLRLISHFDSLKLVAKSMLSAIPRVRNVFMVNLFFIFIFAVVGTQVSAGVARGGDRRTLFNHSVHAHLSAVRWVLVSEGICMCACVLVCATELGWCHELVLGSVH